VKKAIVSLGNAVVAFLLGTALSALLLGGFAVFFPVQYAVLRLFGVEKGLLEMIGARVWWLGTLTLIGFFTAFGAVFKKRGWLACILSLLVAALLVFGPAWALECAGGELVASPELARLRETIISWENTILESVGR